MVHLGHGKHPVKDTCRLETRATAPQLHMASLCSWICPYRHGHSAAVPLCTRTTKQTDLYSSLHHAPTDLLEGAGSYLHFKNAVIKDASASPGQTSTAPCPVSVSYQPPDDTPSILWHSTAVFVLVRGHMTEDALERPTVEWCTFFENVFAFLRNRCFPPKSTVWGRHASKQPFSSPQASTTECSSSCLLSASGYLLGLRCCHAHAHAGLWHF